MVLLYIFCYMLLFCFMEEAWGIPDVTPSPQQLLALFWSQFIYTVCFLSTGPND